MLASVHVHFQVLSPSTASSSATVQIPPESESPTITPTTWAPSESGLPTQGQITQPEDDHTYMPDLDPVELYVSPPPFPEEDEESCLASQLKLATSHPQNIRATPPIQSGVARLSMGRSGPALAHFGWPWPWPSYLRARPVQVRVRADPGPCYI